MLGAPLCMHGWPATYQRLIITPTPLPLPLPLQSALKIEGSAKGCAEAKGDLDVLGVSTALGEALAEAFAINFSNDCGEAVARARNGAFAENVAELLYNATAKTCGEKGEIIRKDVSNALTTKTPVSRALTEIFSIIKRRCACKGKCWCATNCEAASYCPTFGLTGYGAPIGRRL